jgi:hypothetical protein
MRTRDVYALATTLEETRHALQLARALAADAGARRSVIVASPERVTVSSPRAHAHDLPIEDADMSVLRVNVSTIRALAETLGLDPQIIAAREASAPGLASVLPSGATVVICGPMHRFLETPEQRVVRELSKANFDVVFLPHPHASGLPPRFSEQTEMMRHLIG